MPIERFQFTRSDGNRLAATLDLPDREPIAYALFAHCFTCGKDVHAAKRIAEACRRGIAVLRFDFTGLGSSEGDFANSTFSSNVADLVRPPRSCEDQQAPAILIGHSLGGAAVLAAAALSAGGEGGGHHRGAVRSRPCDGPVRTASRISKQGRCRGYARGPTVPHQARVSRRHRRAESDERWLKLRKALLIIHSPTDDTVGIDNATRIFSRPSIRRVSCRSRAPIIF